MNITQSLLGEQAERPVVSLKSTPADFKVDEVLGFDLDGEGEHVWLQVRKTGHNTADVTRAIARGIGIRERDIGYSGMKDRQAITTQWFSFVYPIKSADDAILACLADNSGVELMQWVRHGKKLRIGAHRENRFTVVLRNVELTDDERERTTRQLDEISEKGFPNFFGAQRFGHNGQNIAAARSMFAAGDTGEKARRKKKSGRNKRGIYLSAARSYLFNKVLTERVQNGSWNRVLAGETLLLDGTNSRFTVGQPDDDVIDRHARFDVHTSGPLHGAGEPLVNDAVLELETECLAGDEDLRVGLELAGLKNERRALRAMVGNFACHWIDDTALQLEFTLRRGIYATALLEAVFRCE